MPDHLVVSVPEAALVDSLRELPGVEVVSWDMTGHAPRERIDIVTVPYLEGPAILERLEGVTTQLVQSQSIGFDGVADHLSEGLTFANAKSVHEASSAELAVGLAISMLRGIPDAVRNAATGTWASRTYQALADKRVLLVGYGGVGKAIEARLLPFEVEITRVARTARTERGASGDEVRVHAIGNLHGLLAEADVVITSLPLTKDTEGLIDAGALAAMKPGALLINIGRGGTVDTDALVDALNRGAIQAGLDVVDPEPLPADHPLWQCPGVLITPHIGGDSSARLPRIAALLKRQIAHLQAGEVPENVVLGG